MSKGPTPDTPSEVMRLRDRMLLIIEFIEGVQAFEAGRDLREFVESEAAKKNLRALRLLSREVDAMTHTLEPHERDGLDAVLKAHLGVDRDRERAELARWAALVVERGTIQSERERRRVEQYLEMLRATGGDPGEIQALESLLQSH